MLPCLYVEETGRGKLHTSVNDIVVSSFFNLVIFSKSKNLFYLQIVNGKIVVEKEIEYLMKHFPSADDAMKQKVTECVHKGNKIFILIDYSLIR